MSQTPLIAIVDDDESIRDTTSDLLVAAGYAAATFASPESLLESKRLAEFSCVISDVRMPGMSGLELYKRMVASGSPVPTILVTAYPDEHARAWAINAGVICYLRKPFTPEALFAGVDSAVQGRPMSASQQAAEEMKAVGRFANDLNNVLGGIIAYGEMLLDEVPENTPQKRHAQNVLTAATRGRDAVEQFLAYICGRHGRGTPTDVCRTVAGDSGKVGVDPGEGFYGYPPKRLN